MDPPKSKISRKENMAKDRGYMRNILIEKKIGVRHGGACL
jgi:hypothetical protein